MTDCSGFRGCDQIKYKRKKYSLTNIACDDERVNSNRERRLFNASRLGVKACWRDDFGSYKIVGGRLLLESLMIYLSDTVKMPILGGRYKAKAFTEEEFNDWNGMTHSYLNMCLLDPFSGGLLIADIAISKNRYGIRWPAWRYRRVHELVFSNGKLIKAADRSRNAAKLRAKVAKLQPNGRFTNIKKEIPPEMWIKNGFALGYPQMPIA